MNTGIALIKRQRGMAAMVARELGIHDAAVSRWTRIPAERVAAVAALTGIPRWKLRPDLYEAPAKRRNGR